MRRTTSTVDSIFSLETYCFDSVKDYLTNRDSLKYGYLGQKLYFPYEIAMTFYTRKNFESTRKYFRI